MIDEAIPENPDRLQLARARGWLIASSTLRQSYMAVALQSFLTGYALFLGASNREIGVLGALPALAQVLQLFSPYLFERVSRRRVFCYAFWIAGYALWIPVLLVPWLVPVGWQVWTLLVLVGLSRALTIFPVAARLSWFGDIVPEEIRGRFFGRTNMIAGSSAAVIGMAVGWGLDALGRDADAFAMVFAVALLLGISDLLAFARVPEPAWEHAERRPSLPQILSIPLRDPWFRRFALFVMFFSFAQAVAGPFFAVYMIRDLRVSYMLIGVFAAVVKATMLVFMPLWGYLGDKYGHQPIYRIGCTASALWPLLWLAAAPRFYVLPLVVAHLIAGAITPALTLPRITLLLGGAPEKERSVYYAAFHAMLGVGLVAGPLVGGALAHWFAGVSLPVGSHALTGLPLLFVLSTVLRLLCLPLMPAAREGESGVRVVLSRLVAANPIATLGQIHALVAGSNEQKRANAARTLGKLRAPLAVEELTAALDDASPEVRHEAARALGEIKDPQPVERLIEKLGMEAEDIIEEAAEALGKIGDERALDALAALAVDQSKPEPVRVKALTALGEFQRPEAEEAVRQVLLAESHPGLLAAAALALGHMQSVNAMEKIYDLLGSGECHVARKQIAHALGEMVGEGDRLYGLLAAEEATRDVQVSRILAVVRRRFARCGLREQLPPDRIEAILSDFVADRYAAVVAELARLRNVVEPQLQRRDETVAAALQLMELAGDRARRWDPHLEEALLLIVALRHLAAAMPRVRLARSEE